MISKLPPISCLNCDLTLNILILVKHKNGTTDQFNAWKSLKKWKFDLKSYFGPSVAYACITFIFDGYITNFVDNEVPWSM